MNKEKSSIKGSKYIEKQAENGHNPMFLKTIRIIHRNPLKKAFQALGMIPKSRDLYVEMAKVATVHRYSELMLTATKYGTAIEDMDMLFNAVHDNSGIVAEAIATAVHNCADGKVTPPKWIADAIRGQFTVHDFMEALQVVNANLGLEHFFAAMATVGLLKNSLGYMIEGEEDGTDKQP